MAVPQLWHICLCASLTLSRAGGTFGPLVGVIFLSYIHFSGLTEHQLNVLLFLYDALYIH